MQTSTGVAIGGLMPFRRERERARATVVVRLGAARYQAAYDWGTTMAARDDVYAPALRPEVRRARPADVTPADVTPDDVALADLSPRQREVAVLVSRGHANHEIAQRPHLSVSTAENQLTAVFAKVSVANRAELGTWVGAQHGSPRSGTTPR